MQKRKKSAPSRAWSRMSKSPRSRKPLAMIAAGGLLLALPAGASIEPQSSAPIVNPPAGPIQGFNSAGVHEFLGIPYAQPPVGALRWQPPQAVPVRTAMLAATAYGPTCAQITELGLFAGPANSNEDCLYLNVFTTRLGTGKAPAKMPVLLWIHGGGYVDGESNDYDARKLAQGGPSGPTVVVSINYRLGLLGFLAHPALDAEGHPFANYGLLDQQAAMNWIRRNIAAFGGDPHNITVGGQSAGAGSAALNVISPGAAGLFQRAIFESNGSAGAARIAPLPFAETAATNFAQAAGCGSGKDAATAICLRNLSVPQILALQGTPSANGPYIVGPIVDGTIVPLQPDNAFSTGAFTRMPIMSGSVAGEGGFGASVNEYFHGKLTAAQYTAGVKAAYGGPSSLGGAVYPRGTASKVLAEYPLHNYASPSLAYIAAYSDPTNCRARKLNGLLDKWINLYAYHFTDATVPWYFPHLSFPHLAAHTADIQLLFPRWHGGPLGTPHKLDTQQEKLSDALVADWTSFMYSGNPNSASKQLWPRFTDADPVYLEEDIPVLSTIDDAAFAARHHCEFWDAVLVY